MKKILMLFVAASALSAPFAYAQGAGEEELQTTQTTAEEPFFLIEPQMDELRRPICPPGYQTSPKYCWDAGHHHYQPCGFICHPHGRPHHPPHPGPGRPGILILITERDPGNK